jgi:hypothetical protein
VVSLPKVGNSTQKASATKKDTKRGKSSTTARGKGSKTPKKKNSASNIAPVVFNYDLGKSVKSGKGKKKKKSVKETGNITHRTSKSAAKKKKANDTGFAKSFKSRFDMKSDSESEEQSEEEERPPVRPASSRVSRQEPKKEEGNVDPGALDIFMEGGSSESMYEGGSDDDIEDIAAKTMQAPADDEMGNTMRTTKRVTKRKKKKKGNTFKSRKGFFGQTMNGTAKEEPSNPGKKFE